MTDQTGNEPERTPEEQRILDAAEKARVEAEKAAYDELMKKRYVRLMLDQARIGEMF